MREGQTKECGSHEGNKERGGAYVGGGNNHEKGEEQYMGGQQGKGEGEMVGGQVTQ